MKFFINKPDNVVNESIEGLLTDPNLTKLDSFPEVRVVTRKEIDTSKVAVISGGGSGHEPMHAGFVAKGMLTAAVCGDIFASPSVDAVLAAILAVDSEKGCLLVIKNYTGDRLNFGLAAEQARALGHKVETVIVGDDIALGEDTQQRGLAGTLLVHKVAGQLAEEGKSLDEVTKAAKKVAESAISIGLSLTEGQKFNNPEESRLDKTEAELGLGIHGEPGVDVIKMDQADALVQKAVDKLKDIQKSQLAYRQLTGKFAKDFNQLIEFIDTAEFTLTERRDTLVLDEELTRRYRVDTNKEITIIDTLGFVPVKDSLFNGNQERYRTMMNVPIEGVDEKFELRAGTITKGENKIPVFEARVAKAVVLSDQDRTLILQENEVQSVDDINGRYISVGSMTEVSTSGNGFDRYGGDKDN